MALEPILIKPRDLPAAEDVYADDAMVVDNGVTVGRGTPVQVVNAGAPVASQAEAIAGVDNAKRMTALRVKQVLDNEVAPAVLRAQAWAESPTNPNPSDPNSKSAKTWAAEAEAEADRAEVAAAAMNVRQVADTAALAALPTTQWKAGLLSSGASYLFDADDWSARITAGDPRFVAPASDPSGNNGAWVRGGSFVRGWQPSKWSSVDGSLYNGANAHDWQRTGGWGTYGLDLVSLTVEAEVPAGQFDSGRTTWVSGKNMTGGNLFGEWGGANSPHKDLPGHDWTAGIVAGREINAGNRWAELGYQADYTSAARKTVGVQIVPDIVPSIQGGPPVDIFHGTFGLAFHASIHGHKWWTGVLVSQDSIVVGGKAMRVRGGSVVGNAPADAFYADGYFTSGIDLVNATFGAGSPAIRLGNGHNIRWSGGGVINGAGAGFGISTGNADDDLGLYVNNFGAAVLLADHTGGVPRMRFFGAGAPVAKPAVTGSRGGNAALASALTQLALLGLITDSTTA